jgi:hypothetical protein
MASFLYNSLAADAFAGNIVPGTHTFKMLLTTSGYTPNKDHNRADDITNEVANGNGYTTGGEAVTITITTDNANDRTSVSFSEPSWATATFTARYGVVYRSRGGASSADELVALLDFGADKTSSGGTFATDETTPFYLNH